MIPTRTRTNDEGGLVVEVDIELDVLVTFIFVRHDGPLVYRGTSCDYALSGGKVVRVMYAGEIPAVVLSLAKDRALDACAEHDKAPDTVRGKVWCTSEIPRGIESSSRLRKRRMRYVPRFVRAIAAGKLRIR